MKENSDVHFANTTKKIFPNFLHNERLRTGSFQPTGEIFYCANAVGEESTMVLTENQWLELVPGVSTEAQVLAVMGEPEIKGTASYGSLQKLDILSYSAMASYFFRAGKLQIISVTPDEDKNGLSSKAQTWLAALGDQMRERTMRSHVGKNTLLHLYPRRGLALHVVRNIVEDVEIFPTLSLDNYMKYLYKKPSVFIK